MKDLIPFREAIGQRESSNNYKCVNSLGYLGKYQFGKPRLWDLGYSIDGWKPKDKPAKLFITKEAFLNDPQLQDLIFQKHVEDAKRFAERKLKDYIGKNIHGINITLSGLIAGAHLMGWGNDKNPGVIQFCKQGIIAKDGYGTPITEYISKFAGYDLNHIS